MSINVPGDKARAVVDALERDMFDKLATRSEMAAEFRLVRQEMAAMREALSKDIQALSREMQSLPNAMTAKFGAMTVAGVVATCAIIGALQVLL